MNFTYNSPPKYLSNKKQPVKKLTRWESKLKQKYRLQCSDNSHSRYDMLVTRGKNSIESMHNRHRIDIQTEWALHG